MKKIIVGFPNGSLINALINIEEPALAQSLRELIKDNRIKCVCHNDMSNGYFFCAYPRPSEKPIEKPSVSRTFKYIDLRNGQILWDGVKISIVYGRCTQPGIASAVVAQVEQSYLDEFKEACMNIWHSTYIEHKLAILTVEKGEE